MSAAGIYDTVSMTNFQVMPDRHREPWSERLVAWMAARSRHRLATAQAVLLRRLTSDRGGTQRYFGNTIWLDGLRGTSAATRLRSVSSASMDLVVSAGGLEASSDVAALLSEIKRVLRPGGRLLFAESVAAPADTRLRWLQTRLARLWPVLAGGAHAPRDLWNDLKVARFDRLVFERGTLPGLAGIPIPHLVGEATTMEMHVGVTGSPAAGERLAPAIAAATRRAWREPAFTFFGN